MMLTVAEAATRLNVHPETIRRMIKRGELAALKIGSVYRIKEADLEPERITKTPREPRPDDSPLAEFVRPEWLHQGKAA